MQQSYRAAARSRGVHTRGGLEGGHTDNPKWCHYGTVSMCRFVLLLCCFLLVVRRIRPSTELFISWRETSTVSFPKTTSKFVTQRLQER